MIPYLHKIATDFAPLEVGPAITETNKMVPLIDHKRNALWGAGVGSATALLTYALQSAINSRKPKDKKKSATKMVINSLLAGGATGLATYGAMSIWQNLRGTNFSHDYKVPDLKEGEKPDFHIMFSGSNGGPWQNHPKMKYKDGTPMINWDVEGAALEHGKNRTAHMNGFDTDYAKQYIKEIVAKHPTARIRISGHSMGGATAYEIAQWAAKEGINIDRLDTFDPVSRFTKFKGKPSTTRMWVNYRPDKIEPFKNMPDFWSWVGGMHKNLEGSIDKVISNPNINNHRMVRFAPLFFAEDGEYSDYPTSLMQYLVDSGVTVDKIKEQLDEQTSV